MFLHNTVAHSHEVESVRVQQCEVDAEWCLMEWLESVFQMDFGQDHLEYFNVAYDKGLDIEAERIIVPNIVSIISISSFVEINQIKKNVFDTRFPLLEHESNTLFLRGPPAIS